MRLQKKFGMVYKILATTYCENTNNNVTIASELNYSIKHNLVPVKI